jgi:hypothetical protein
MAIQLKMGAGVGWNIMAGIAPSLYMFLARVSLSSLPPVFARKRATKPTGSAVCRKW